MPGLDPGIHSVTVAIVAAVTEWMPWSSHGMTTMRSKPNKNAARRRRSDSWKAERRQAAAFASSSAWAARLRFGLASIAFSILVVASFSVIFSTTATSRDILSIACS
jgi:hypothetical protein